MNDDNMPNVAGSRDDQFRRLFRHTKPRLRPSPADESRIRAELHADWHATIDRRVRVGRAFWGVATAAALLLAVIAFVRVDPMLYGEPEIVAALERIDGGVDVIRDDGVLVGSAIEPGLSIAAGAMIDTGGGRAALTLANGGSLRLDTNTRIAFAPNRTVELVRGSLYFDSESSGESEPLTVLTSVGSVRDIGTQFIARQEPGFIAVSVREGTVAIDRQDDGLQARVGERLTVADTGDITMQRVDTFGDEWGWADDLAPVYDLDGQTVYDFLLWIERQTGRHVVYVSTEVESAAKTSVLRGGRIDLEPLSMLRAVLATSDLGFSLTEGEIAVSAR